MVLLLLPLFYLHHAFMHTHTHTHAHIHKCTFIVFVRAMCAHIKEEYVKLKKKQQQHHSQMVNNNINNNHSASVDK